MDTFRAGGKGGQAQNKTSSGVRFTHLASGAVGEFREERQQIDNKRRAWRRMAESPKFKAWWRLEVARQNGEEAAIEAEVDRQMLPHNMLIEEGSP